MMSEPQQDDPTWGESLVRKLDEYLGARDNFDEAVKKGQGEPLIPVLQNARRNLVDELDEFLNFAIEAQE